jgi:hypothetical protein
MTEDEYNRDAAPAVDAGSALMRRVLAGGAAYSILVVIGCMHAATLRVLADEVEACDEDCDLDALLKRWRRFADAIENELMGGAPS